MILIIVGDDPTAARWQALCRNYRLGGLGTYDDTHSVCCAEGHHAPDEALLHGFLVERDRVLFLLAELPADSWGRIVMEAAS